MLQVGRIKQKRKSSNSKYHTLKPQTQRNYSKKHSTINQSSTNPPANISNIFRNNQRKASGQQYCEKIISKTERQRKGQSIGKSLQQIEKLKEDFNDMKIAVAKLSMNQNHLKTRKINESLKATPTKQFKTICNQYNNKIDKIQSQLQIKQLTNQKQQQSSLKSHVFAFQTIDFAQNIKKQINGFVFQHIKCQSTAKELQKANKHIKQLTRISEQLKLDYLHLAKQNQILMSNFDHKNLKNNKFYGEESDRANMHKYIQELKLQNEELRQFIKSNLQQKHQSQIKILSQINQLQQNHLATCKQIDQLNDKILNQLTQRVDKHKQIQKTLKKQLEESVNNYNQLIINKSAIDTKFMESLKENHLQKEQILYLKDYLQRKQIQYKDSQKLIQEKDEKIALYEQMLLKIIQKLLDLQRQVAPSKRLSNHSSITEIRGQFQQLLQFIQTKQNSEKQQIFNTIQTLKKMNSHLKDDLHHIVQTANHNQQEIHHQNILLQTKLLKLQQQIKHITELFQDLCTKAALVQDANQHLKQQIALQERDILELKTYRYEVIKYQNQFSNTKKQSLKNNMNRVALSQIDSNQHEDGIMTFRDQESIKEIVVGKDKRNEGNQHKSLKKKQYQAKSKYEQKQNNESDIKLTLFGKDLMVKAKNHLNRNHGHHS